MILGFCGKLLIASTLLLVQLPEPPEPADLSGSPEAVQPAGEGAPEAAQNVNPIIEFLKNPINLLLVSAILFMFIVVRPQQRQAREQQKALAELKKNDRVVTAAGIHGVVVQAAAGEKVVTIRIDENSGARMTVNRDTITKIVNPDSKE
ncbi:MAG: preprotein translocase subunit YajC [Pirellulaceae bacterium]